MATHPVTAKKEAVAAVTGKKPKKVGAISGKNPTQIPATGLVGKPAKKAPSRDGKTTVRGHKFTSAWKDADGQDIPMGARVKDTATGIVGKVVSRWTKPGEQRIPHVSVEPEGATATATAGGRTVKAIGIPAAQLKLHGKQPA